MLGDKLKRYREQFQLSHQELSEATGISADVLSQFETGQREPTGDEILVLADFFRCDYRFFISNEKLAAFEQTETLFRMDGDQLSREDRWAIQEFLFLCECEEFLMQELHPAERTPFVFSKQGTFYKGHGESAAESLRRHLGYQPHAVNRDVFQDFRQIGLHVFRRSLENSNISGLFIKHPYAGKCVLVNDSEDPFRQRFTAAHEAGHAILDDDKDVVVSFARWDHSDLSEVRANTFASRFLMPQEFLRSLPAPGQWPADKVQEWCLKLMVNPEPLSYALKDADIISDTQRDAIRVMKVPQGLKPDAELPASLAPRSRERGKQLLKKGLSAAYAGLCLDAYDRGLISAGRMAEMLLVNHGELEETLEVFGGTRHHGD